MDNLIAKMAAATQTTPEVARQASATVLDFLQREAPEPMGRILDKAPALKAVIASGAQSGGEGMGGGLKGLMGVGAGAMGGGGVMALGGQLMGLGLSMDQIQSLGKAMFEYLRENVGDELVGEISAEIPGISQFI